MNIVKKFGGVFQRNSEDLSAIVANIERSHSRGDNQIIVVAAMHSYSDFIKEELAKLPPKYTKADLDRIFTKVEYLSAERLHDALLEKGLKVRIVNNLRGSHLNEIDKYFGKRELNMEEVQATINTGEIPIIPGYQGIGSFSEEDTFGRYGAAATATAIAGYFGYDCVLYGNVDGIYTMKPKDGGRLLHNISYEEAMEMTALVKSDLESRAIEIASALGVKIIIGRNLEEEPGEGTVIMSKDLFIQEGAVTGIAVSDNIAIFTLQNIPFEGDSISELFEIMADIGVDVDAISQQTFDNGTVSVFFSADSSKVDIIKETLDLNPRMKNLEMSVRDHIALISIVGVGMVSHPGIAAKVFRCLAGKGICHYNITTSEITISAAIDMVQRDQAIVALAQEFDL